jgi:hypothetical protein
MSSTKKNYKWLYLPIIIVLCLIAGVGTVLVVNQVSQNHPHIPPCEAMRPYIEYHNLMFYETAQLQPSELGSAVTMIGDGADQAKSCLDSGATVYSVKGYPVTTHLAVGLTMFVAYVPTLSSTPSISTSAASASAGGNK